MSVVSGCPSGQIVSGSPFLPDASSFLTSNQVSPGDGQHRTGCCTMILSIGVVLGSIGEVIEFKVQPHVPLDRIVNAKDLGHSRPARTMVSGYCPPASVRGYV